MAKHTNEDGRVMTATEQQKKYIAARAKGMNSHQAAQAAGYSQPRIQSYSVEKSPLVRRELEKEWKRAEKMAEMTKKKVMDGLLEAVEQAKMLADPSAQISGWREIAKMCGYYEPQRLQVEVSVSAKRLFSKYEALSDDELLKLADQTIIDSDDFEVVDENDETRG